MTRGNPRRIDHGGSSGAVHAVARSLLEQLGQGREREHEGAREDHAQREGSPSSKRHVARDVINVAAPSPASLLNPPLEVGIAAAVGRRGWVSHRRLLGRIARAGGARVCAWARGLNPPFSALHGNVFAAKNG